MLCDGWALNPVRCGRCQNVSLPHLPTTVARARAGRPRAPLRNCAVNDAALSVANPFLSCSTPRAAHGHDGARSLHREVPGANMLATAARARAGPPLAPGRNRAPHCCPRRRGEQEHHHHSRMARAGLRVLHCQFADRFVLECDAIARARTQIRVEVIRAPVLHRFKYLVAIQVESRIDPTRIYLHPDLCIP